jgi:coproporphyrinogen III oxidase-like Fe-S oxidoreductase
MPANPALLTLPPLSLYIHIPWCVQKCPYCDFNSHAIQKKSNAKQSNTQLDSFEDKIIPEDQYINALLEDLEQELPSVWGRSITSIFIGGGTPSLLSVKAMDKLLSGIRARLPFLADTEVTMEANPGTVE